jgi:Zn-dependent M16 (insulinase) family peptidase
LQDRKQVSGTTRKYAEIPDSRLESIAFPAGVCFNAVALQGAPYESDSNTIESVLAHLISTDFLWEQVRQQGGAYGAHASSSGMAAAFIFSSYRDPNIVSTLGAFRKSLELIRDGKVTMDEVSKAIIGTVASAEKPYPPGEKALVSLKRLLFRITDEARQKRRSIVLGCTVEDLAKAADYLLSKYDDAYTVTIASRDKIGLESSRMPGLMSNITDFSI